MEQAVVLLKTLYLFSHTQLDVFIITNDPNIFSTILAAVREWNTRLSLSLHQVPLHYPPGMEDMMEMFRSESGSLIGRDPPVSGYVSMGMVRAESLRKPADCWTLFETLCHSSPVPGLDVALRAGLRDIPGH